jgi:hypothetical protein
LAPRFDRGGGAAGIFSRQLARHPGGLSGRRLSLSCRGRRTLLILLGEPTNLRLGLPLALLVGINKKCQAGCVFFVQRLACSSSDVRYAVRPMDRVVSEKR